MRTPHVLDLSVRAALLGALALAAVDASAKKPKKPAASAGPVVGWHREAGWAGDCWRAPDFSTMPEGTKRTAWQESRDALLSQWRGERNDGVTLNSTRIDRIENAMLAEANRIERVVGENLEQCKAARASGDTTAWDQWLGTMADRLTEGECPTPPLDYTAFQALSLNAEWQFPLPVCKGDRVNIHATETDHYQLEPKGPFMNAAGDPNQPATSGLPCTIEGCLRGQLVLRFTSVSGVSQVVPVGLDLDFLAPEHGRIEVMINDDSLSDNKYRTQGRIEDHTTLTVKPSGS